MKIKDIEVPFEKIDPEVLRMLIEEYITRDGTFYGTAEMDMKDKIEMVIRQLKSGDILITWDLESQTSNIVLKKDIAEKRGRDRQNPG
ncbi:YheU family protein [bacterium]|nr:YheU family protein [bacterium]